MHTRTMRALGIAAVSLLTASASSGALAQTPKTPSDETSLLGVRLLASYSDVLRKFGQPNEIQPGEPTVSGQGIAATAGQTRGMGGLPGMGGAPMSSSLGGGMGMPGMGGRRGGIPGGPPVGMAGGAPMSSSMPSGMRLPGMAGGGIPGGPPIGSGGAPMSSSLGGGMGMPGMAGRGGIPGGPSIGSSFPGMGRQPGNAAVAGTEDSGETTWWYHFPSKGLHYSFLFNKDGRVIQIQAYGQKPAAKIVAPRSAQGITLGSDFGQVLRKYGWSNDGEHVGDYVVMRYGKTDRIAFQSRNNRVLGIVLGRVVPPPPVTADYTGYNGYPGGAGGYPGGAGGYPGGAGAGGR